MAHKDSFTALVFPLPSRGEAHSWTENKNTLPHTKKITTHDPAVCGNDNEILTEREKKKTGTSARI